MSKEILLIGVDEAGRGALAGPLIVAAVYGSNQQLSFCHDSKTLTHQQRLAALTTIQRTAPLIGIGWVDAHIIDRFGITRALQLAAEQALSFFSKFDCGIILDGNHDYIKRNNVQTVIKADNLVKQVAAASIVAKIFRDRYMSNISASYQQWEFEKHKGYGTARHMAIINRIGTSAIHRLSFKPCQLLKTIT